MLPNTVTGELREVDVVIRSKVAGQEMVLGVEATMQKGSSPWVEQMIGKHEELPTDRLVLVAERGFSRPARRYAQRKRVAVISPEDLTADDPALRIVNRIETMWPKGVNFTLQHTRLLVRTADGLLRRVREVPEDAIIMDEHEREIITPAGILPDLFVNNFLSVAESVGLADIAEDRDEFFVMRLGSEEDPVRFLRHGEPVTAYLRWEESEPPELHELLAIELRGRAVISVAEVRLTHRRFGGSLVAYGTAGFAGHDALFVVTEGEQDAKLSIRLRDEAPETPSGEEEQDGGAYSGGDSVG